MPKKKRTYFKIQNKLVPFIGRVAGTHLVAHHRREPRLPFCQSYEPSAGRKNPTEALEKPLRVAIAILAVRRGFRTARWGGIYDLVYSNAINKLIYFFECHFRGLVESIYGDFILL